MPFNAPLIVGVVGVLLALVVWARTRRVGPVVGVIIGAFVIMAITDTSILTRGGQAVGDLFGWAIDSVLRT